MQLIDGKKIASEIKAEIALEVKEMLAQGHQGAPPGCCSRRP